MTKLLHAVFRGHSGFIAFAVFAIFLSMLLVYFGTRKRSVRPIFYALFVGSVVGVVSLTLWAPVLSTGEAVCTVNRDLLEPLSTEQGLLNAAMFAPVGLFGALATRRILFSAGIGTLLTLGIEVTQGSIPALGRGCDTSDIEMNCIGAFAAVILAIVILSIGHRASELRVREVRRSESYAAIGIIFALAIVSYIFVTPTVVTGTLAVKQASDAQQQAIRSAVNRYFGNHYKIKSIQFFSGGSRGTGTVMAAFPVGYLEIDWPGRENVTASLASSTLELSNGYPLDGPASRRLYESDGKKLALQYANKHAPWGVKGSRLSVNAVGKDAELGWMVSWRRYHAGVLMPMRLNVQIGPSGRVSQIDARNIPDPTIPEVSVTRDQAFQALLKTEKFKDDVMAKTADLMATSEQGKWTATWRIAVSGRKENALAYVDASSGKIFTFTVSPVR